MTHHTKEKNMTDKFLLLWERPLFASLILCGILTIVFLSIFVVSDGNPRVDDRYFHMKYAYLLRTEGLDVVKNFDWIYMINDQDGVHRYSVSLFQIALIPFTFFSDLIFAIDVVDALFASAAIALFYYIMRKEKVRYPLFFALVLVGTSFFITRLLMGRAYVFVMSLVFLEMYFAIQKKYVPLAVLVAFHVLWHQATYFMPLIIIGIVELARYLNVKKIDRKNLIYGGCGFAAGMIFFPGFPFSLISRMKNLFFVNSVAADGSIGAGEMVGKNIFIDLVDKDLLLFVLLLGMGSAVFFFYAKNTMVEKDEKCSKKIHWIFSLALFMIFVLCGSFFISARFFDFVLPTTIFLFAMVLTTVLSMRSLRIDDGYMQKISFALWIWLACVSVLSVRGIYANANYFEYRPIGQAAAWIEKNSDNEREKVFLHNWSHFTVFFFGNHYNAYSMGIEPASLKARDEGLYWKYYNMFAYAYYCELEGDCEDRVKKYYAKINSVDPQTRSYMDKKNSENIIQSLKTDFDAKFVVSDSSEFTRVIALSPEFIAARYDMKPSQFQGNALTFTVFKLK